MVMISEKKLMAAGKDLEAVVKEARRRLFEFGTMMSAYEFGQGKTQEYRSALALIRSAKKGR